MTRVAMTIDKQPNANVLTPLDLAALHTFDNADGMTFPATGDIMIQLHNATGGALTVTVISQPEPDTGRTKDISAYSIVAGHTIWLPRFPALGWGVGGVVEIDASGALQYAAIQIGL